MLYSAGFTLPASHKMQYILCSKVALDKNTKFPKLINVNVNVKKCPNSINRAQVENKSCLCLRDCRLPPKKCQLVFQFVKITTTKNKKKCTLYGSLWTNYTSCIGFHCNFIDFNAFYMFYFFVEQTRSALKIKVLGQPMYTSYIDIHCKFIHFNAFFSRIKMCCIAWQYTFVIARKIYIFLMHALEACRHEVRWMACEYKPKKQTNLKTLLNIKIYSTTFLMQSPAFWAPSRSYHGK